MAEASRRTESSWLAFWCNGVGGCDTFSCSSCVPTLSQKRFRLSSADVSERASDSSCHHAEGDWLRQRIPDGPVALRTDNVSTALSAVKAGVGLGLLPDALAEGLVKVELGASPPTRGVWISMHPTSARQPRVRTVVRWLADTFQSLAHPLRQPIGKKRR